MMWQFTYSHQPRNMSVVWLCVLTFHAAMLGAVLISAPQMDDSEKSIAMEMVLTPVINTPAAESHLQPVLKSKAAITHPEKTAPSPIAPAVQAHAASTSNDAVPATATTASTSRLQAMPALTLPSSEAQGLNNPKPLYPKLSRRLNEQGQVVIQTADPNHPILQLVLAHNYNGLYQREILHRQQFSYPPFTRMIELKLRHKEANVVDKAALFIANEIRKIGECTVLGPAVPFVSKINNYYIRELLLKTNQQTKDLSQLKLKVRRVIDFMKTQAELKSTDVSIDVDP